MLAWKRGLERIMMMTQLFDSQINIGYRGRET